MRLRNFFVLTFFSLSLSLSYPAAAQAVWPSFADLAEKLIPSVVNISTTHDKNDPAEESGDIDNNIETTVDSIFNAPSTNKVSLGSGFIISADGFIITNNHVIDKADTISVTLADNRTVEAKLVGRDPKTDIALIKIDTTTKLKPVSFGNSDKIRVGDWILAIGNPFGLGGSVTAGIVSAKSRDIESGPYDSFIQTDASINQGSSGGPMFNLDGEVIGVNTAIFSTNGGSMGIGFAIPVNLIDFVIKQLKAHGEVRRGWIGIKMQPNSADMASSLGLPDNQGVIISEVPENSSAAKAGIKAGDIILKFDGHQIDNTKNLSRMVAETAIGKLAEVEIWRNNQKQILKVTVEKMLETPVVKKENPQTDNPEVPDIVIEETEMITSPAAQDLGIVLEEINGENIHKYSLPEASSGMIVTEVAAGSDAARKGIKTGDIITQIDKKTIVDAQDVSRLVNEAIMENKRPVLLLVKDGEQLHFVAVKLSSTAENTEKEIQ